jgi:hypothetical protein
MQSSGGHRAAKAGYVLIIEHQAALIRNPSLEQQPASVGSDRSNYRAAVTPNTGKNELNRIAKSP